MRYLLCILLFGFINLAQAQKFTASANKTTIGLNESVVIKFILNASGEDFIAPGFDGFHIMSGPSVSSSTSIINGSFSQSIGFTYVLKPLKTGTVNIEPASIRAGRKRIRSNALAINVTNSATKDKRQDQQNADIKDNLFIRVIPDKTEVIEGDAVKVTYKLYSRDIELRNMAPVDLPSFPGFWTEEIPVESQLTSIREEFNGQTYDTWIVKETILFPQKNGTLTIDPLELRLTGYKRYSQGSILDDFFNHFPYHNDLSSQAFHINVKSPTAKLRVSPLPSPKPSAFNGFVGNAAINTSLDKTELKANEALTYRVTVGGEGNLKLLSAFELDLGDKAEVYDPKISENLELSHRNITGTKTFEYTIIPRKEGSLKIPPLIFSYYDPDKKAYEEQSTASYTINVLKGEPGPGDDIKPPAEKDIETTANGMGVAAWTAIVGAPLLLGLFIFLVYHKKNKTAAGKAEPTLKEEMELRLHDLKELAQTENDKKFYSAALNMLYHYLELKGIEKSDIIRSQILQYLIETGHDEEFAAKFMALLEQLETAAYAPVFVPGDKLTTWKEINTLLI